MKKIIIVCIIIIWCLCVVSCSNKTLYNEGKDTVKSYGDGRYQIMHQVNNNMPIQILMNCKYNQCMMSIINNYSEDGNNVYFIGNYNDTEVYCVLDKKTNYLKYYAKSANYDDMHIIYAYDMQSANELLLLDDFDSFSETEKQEFYNLKVTKQ